jgi:signal transduction histidine kinase
MTARLQGLQQRLRQPAFALTLVVAVVVAALMLAISEMGYRQSASQLSTLVIRGQARLELLQLVHRLSHAESGQRGQLLTGQSDYLLPYRDASASVLSGLGNLRSQFAAIGGDSDQAGLAALDRQVRTRLSELDAVLALADAGRGDAARELVQTGIGRQAMDGIRQQTEQLLAAQNSAVRQGLGTVYDTLLLNRVGVASMTLLSLLVLGLYLRQRRHGDRERRRQQQLLRAERDRLELQVQHRTAELTELARHLETAREDERALLARDLHDELGALLTAAKLDVARMRPKLAQAAPELAPRMSHLVEVLNSGIALKRRIIEDLRSSSLSTLGLGPALEILCKDFAERLDAALCAEIAPVALTPSGELTVFRLVQESLTNIAKHAQASHIMLQVRPAGAQLEVRIGDDGIGFDPQQPGMSRHGLVGMRYRVQAEGGVLSVHSQPGQGTLVHALLPVQREAAGMA